MKKIMLFLAVFSVAAGTMPLRAQNYAWTTNNGTITITAYGGPDGTLTVPSMITGLPVTGIGDLAFEYSRLASVTIPTGVTSIGSSAFQYCSLTRITIPNSVTNIGSFAFADSGLTNIAIPAGVTSIGTGALLGCSNLTMITVDASNPIYRSVVGVLFNKNQTTLIQYPAGRAGGYIVPLGITSIEYSAFEYSGLTSFMLPNSVTNIADAAFASCLSLTSATFPSSVRSIGNHAFEFSGLTSVTIPDSVTSIGNAAFAACPNMTTITVSASNPVYSSLGGVLFNKNQTTLIQCPGGLAWAYSVPNGVISIAEAAFISCSSLTSITIPSGVTSIGPFSFQYCSLTSVTIPNSVISIGEAAFYGCTNLTAIMVDEANPIFSSAGGVLFDKNQTTLIQYPGGLTGAFAIPSSVTRIGDSAFIRCRLTGVTIPGSVLSIGSNAFSDVGSLTSVSIPNSVTNIEVPAFAGCTNLTAITVDASNHDYSSMGGILFNKSHTDLVVCPAGLAGVYTIPGSVTNIEEEAFFESSLTDVAIPNSVLNFGAFAFSASHLASATIPNSIINIADDAFFDCDSLTNATISSSVTSINFGAFSDCGSLTGVYFQGNAPTLNGDAFLDAAAGAAVYYLDGTTGWGALYGRLPTVMLNSEGKVIGSLSNVGLPDNEFGFTFNGTNNQIFVVETSASLTNPNWQPIQTNTLSGTFFNFTDPQWQNYASRFYRVGPNP